MPNGAINTDWAEKLKWLHTKVVPMETLGLLRIKYFLFAFSAKAEIMQNGAKGKLKTGGLFKYLLANTSLVPFFSFFIDDEENHQNYDSKNPVQH